ncbi:MAG: hypothetical protein EZS28_054032, partial [Streblomastix strix]
MNYILFILYLIITIIQTSPAADYYSILRRFENLASLGYVPAQRMAGWYHSVGLGFSKGLYRNTSSIDWDRSLLYNTFAAKYNTDAKLALATQISKGLQDSLGGPARDCSVAEQILSEVAEKILIEALQIFYSPEVRTAWLFVVPPCLVGIQEDICLNATSQPDDSYAYIENMKELTQLHSLFMK